MVKFRDIEDVKAEMRRRGITSVSISKSSGVPESTIRMAMIGRSSRKGEEAIADALKLPLHEVFPDRWYPDGTRYDGRCIKHRANPPRTHRPIARAG